MLCKRLKVSNVCYNIFFFKESEQIVISLKIHAAQPQSVLTAFATLNFSLSLPEAAGPSSCTKIYCYELRIDRSFEIP